MRISSVGSVLGVIAGILAWGGHAEAQNAAPCPMKQLAQGYYCEKDSQIVGVKDVKRNKHVGCDNPVVKVRICAPKLYKCAAADDKDCKMVSLRSGRCKCRKPLQLSEQTPSILQYECTGCGVKGLNRSKLPHDKEQDKAAKKKAVKLVCDHGAESK